MTAHGHNLTVQCDDPELIVGVVNALMPLLPAATRKQLNNIKLGILQSEGVSGLYNRLNGRHVDDIIATEAQRGLGEPIESGERDGITYTLYDAKDET